MAKGPDADTSGEGVAVTPRMVEFLRLPEPHIWVPITEQQKVFWDRGKVRLEARCAKRVGTHYQRKAKMHTVPASGGPERSGSWAGSQDCKVIE